MVGGKGSVYSNDLLKLVFWGQGIPGIADNTATNPATVLSVALHTADPGVGNPQNTNEAAYAGYARLPVARTSAAWAISGEQVSPVASLTFNACTSGSETENWFSVAVPTSGNVITGALVIMYRGPITPALAVTAGNSPQLTPGTVINEL